MAIPTAERIEASILTHLTQPAGIVTTIDDVYALASAITDATTIPATVRGNAAIHGWEIVLFENQGRGTEMAVYKDQSMVGGVKRLARYLADHPQLWCAPWSVQVH